MANNKKCHLCGFAWNHEDRKICEECGESLAPAFQDAILLSLSLAKVEKEKKRQLENEGVAAFHIQEVRNIAREKYPELPEKLAMQLASEYLDRLDAESKKVHWSPSHGEFRGSGNRPL